VLKSLLEKTDPATTALLVVDMQNDFCHPEGAGAVNGGDVGACVAMAPRLKRLIAAARTMGIQPIFIRAVHNRWTDSPARLDRNHGRRAGICREGTWGAEWYGVAPEPADPIVTKHRYSAFINTDLDLILRAQGIEHLILTGVATNGCVESTARDGFMMDYHIVFVDDCSATSAGPAAHAATVANMGRAFGVVVQSADLLALWSEPSVELGVPAEVGIGVAV
jgi:ureidoacrylate peracid hydrolase